MLRVRKKQAFTLVETLVVMSTTALIVMLALTYRPRDGGVKPQQFEEAFASVYASAKTRAQSKEQEQVIDFDQDGMVDQGQILPYPNGYQIIKIKKIRISPSGFVSPQTISWQTGKEIWKLIIQFGGGSYRFTK